MPMMEGISPTFRKSAVESIFSGPPMPVYRELMMPVMATPISDGNTGHPEAVHDSHYEEDAPGLNLTVRIQGLHQQDHDGEAGGGSHELG